MDDLGLFRKLRAGELGDDDALAATVEALAGIPIALRWPFFGVLLPLVSHASAAVRAAAVRALRQADGLLALETVVAALDDPDDSVRVAAVEALAGVTSTHAWRFAHAVFHASPVVRRAALETETAKGAHPLLFYLVEDPDLREAVLLRARAAKDPVLLPYEGLLVPLDLVRRGVIDATDARLVMTRQAAHHALAMRALPGRDVVKLNAIVSACLGSATRPDLTGDLGKDELDELVAVFDGASDEESAPFWRALGLAMHVGDGQLARRLFASLVIVGARRDPPAPIPLYALALVAAHQPAVLDVKWIPLDTRRKAIALFPSMAAHLAKREANVLVPHLFAEPFSREGGGPLVSAVVALLGLVKQPWKAVSAALGEPTLVDLLAREPDSLAPLFELPDDGTGARKELLAKLEAARPLELARALATAAVTAPKVVLGPPTDPALAVRVIAELVLHPRTADARRASAVVAELASSTSEASADTLLRAWLVAPSPSADPMGLALVGRLASLLGTERFVARVLALHPAMQKRLVQALPFATRFPWGTQVALAQALAGSGDPWIAEWAKEALTPPSERVRPPALPGRVEGTLAVELATVSEAQLARVLAPCVERPHAGVASALATRADGAPSVPALTALLLSRDAPDEVLREIARRTTPDTLAEAMRAVVPHADAPVAPGLLGRAVLYRWEAHARAVLRELEARGGLLAARGGAHDALVAARLDGRDPVVAEVAGAHDALAQAVRDASTCDVPELGACVVACLAEWARDAGMREPAALAARASDALVAALADALRADPAVAFQAARALVAIRDGRAAEAALAAAREAVRALLPDLDAKTRDALAPWLDSDGLPPAPARARLPLPDGALLDAIRRATDTEWLRPLATADTRRVVDEAVVRLAELPGGADVLASLLAASPPPPHAEALAESLALWPDGSALDAAEALARDAHRPLSLRFRLALELGRRGRTALAELAVELAVASPALPPFVRARDVEHLRAALPLPRVVVPLAASAEPHAYRPAVDALLAEAARGSDASVPLASALAALRSFLDAGTHRMGELRRRAAAILHRAGDPDVLPIVLAEAVRSGTDKDLLVGVPTDAAIASARALLVAGPRVATDTRIDGWIRSPGVPPEVELEVAPDLLVWSRDDKLRERIARRLSRPDRRAWKLREVAETFAWGIARGRELTGRLFDVRMIGGRAWGYTRFDQNTVHVTTLPILRQVRWGRQIVEGLILHELGHHIYHRGPRSKEVWAEATRAGLHGLLNLVADEHLERNLRGIDAEYGDRLKRLVAHAFQHADKEVAVRTLLSDLGGRAYAVLTASPLRVARDDDSVTVHNGELLLAMERAGLSFPRFVRSLRMGLGDRHGDPKVQQALDWFSDKSFRGSSMDDLWKITLKLRELFGWEVKLIERLGAPESLEPGHPDETIHGEGITDTEVSGEVERVLDPRGRQDRPEGRGGKPWVNVSPDEAFDPIEKVVPVKYEPAAHAAIAREVARPARTMRSLLEHLGMRGVPEKRRLAGRSFDRSSARALVLVGDPHVLVARPQKPFDDLFMGIVIDCSGSMSSRGNMDRAKRFATLLAEAARGLDGVTLRVFGFTDKVIYEAGSADRCAAHALVAAGGNNDAAALWYTIGVARKSRRKARLVVMISDGLPTECSVAALRAVVRRGKREGILCAQVAVQPLAEVCFPHYVVVDDADLSAAAKRFGQIAANLVRTALSS